MQTATKTMLNYFLIGILAVIPIVVVIQIILFIKSLLMGVFGMVHGYADSYFYTFVFFIISFLCWFISVIKSSKKAVLCSLPRLSRLSTESRF